MEMYKHLPADPEVKKDAAVRHILVDFSCSRVCRFRGKSRVRSFVGERNTTKPIECLKMHVLVSTVGSLKHCADPYQLDIVFVAAGPSHGA